MISRFITRMIELVRDKWGRTGNTVFCPSRRHSALNPDSVGAPTTCAQIRRQVRPCRSESGAPNQGPAEEPAQATFVSFQGSGELCAVAVRACDLPIDAITVVATTGIAQRTRLVWMVPLGPAWTHSPRGFLADRCF